MRSISRGRCADGETNALRRATSVGHPQINDWFCDVAKAGCLRPTARPADGRAYPEGTFYFRENYAVCEACYRRGHAEDCHGGSDRPIMEAGVASTGAVDALDLSMDGWLRSEFHRFLGFAGRQSRREASGADREAGRQTAATQREAVRAHGGQLQQEAAAQRARASAADEEQRQERAATVEQMCQDAKHRASRAERIRHLNGIAMPSSRPPRCAG